MKRFKWFALFAALFLVLAACGNQEKEQAAEKNDSKDSYTVKHAMGTATGLTPRASTASVASFVSTTTFFGVPSIVAVPIACFTV